MANKCPLCQGKVEQGYCVSCGYRVPDESDIENLTSKYSLNPEEEQPSFKSFRDASVRIAPNIKVASDTRPQPYTPPQTPHGNFGQAANNTASQWNNTHPQQNNNTGWQNGTGTQNGNNASQGVPYSDAGSRQNTGWQSGTGMQNQTNQNTASGNNVPFEPYQPNVYNNGSYSSGEKGFIAQRWWMILVAVLVPIVGFIFAATLRANPDPEAKKLQKILIIISIIRIFLFPYFS